MPVAEVKPVGPLPGTCPNCGGDDRSARLVTASTDGVVGWTGCTRCFERELRRGHLPVLQEMMRAAWGRAKDQPGAAEEGRRRRRDITTSEVNDNG